MPALGVLGAAIVGKVSPLNAGTLALPVAIPVEKDPVVNVPAAAAVPPIAGGEAR